MVKYLFLILVTLLSGCTADFSGLEKPEEAVCIRFTSAIDIQADVVEATRSGYALGQSVGILGIALPEDMMDEATIGGANERMLRQWMANDVYYRNVQGGMVHSKGQKPTFPIEQGSAIVAYAYMPHSGKIAYEAGDCYIPLDLMADSATTDWMYSGKVAKSKEKYLEDRIFKFGFEHALTRLDIVVNPQTNRFDKSFRIKEVSLGIYSHGKGRLSLEDGTVTMDTASYVSGSIHNLRRIVDHELSIYNNITTCTESFYLIPYTKIHDLRIVGVWDEAESVSYEYVIADSTRWNSNNLRPGTRSVINVNLIRNNK